MTELKTANIDMVNPEMADIQVEGTERSDFLLKGALAAGAIFVFLVLVMGLIWAYFREFKMSIAAILALLHDLIVTVGVYALVGFTVTPATMIGVLNARKTSPTASTAGSRTSCIRRAPPVPGASARGPAAR